MAVEILLFFLYNLIIRIVLMKFQVHRCNIFLSSVYFAVLQNLWGGELRGGWKQGFWVAFPKMNQLILFYNLVRMKFKKEYRWLLFLIIPFIVFMFVLFMVPLQIALNAQPLATLAYSLQKGENTQTQLRSAGYQSSKSLNLYLKPAGTVFALFAASPQSEFFETNVDSVPINNAYAYFKNGTARNISLQTMWFASSKTLPSQLTPAQTAILNTVRMNQSPLKAFLGAGGDFGSAVVGVYNFYAADGSSDDMAFYYPTYREANYSSLSYAIDRTLYKSLTANFQATNNSYALLANVSRKGLAESIITICKLRSGGSAPGFTCVDLDAAKFNSMAVDCLGGIVSLANFYLVSPSTQDTNATIINNITFSGSKTVNKEAADSILFDILPYSSLRYRTSSSQWPYMLTVRTSVKSYYLFGLTFQQQAANSVAGYFLGENYQTTNTVDVQSTNVLSNSLNTLLIPTFILIFISLIISVVVLRFLMNGLDLQLHKLNERCKFIFDGDLQIEIPEYQGTKDIYQVYEQVKIINKLHRYTSKDYFVGHFSNRIFKYNEALQVVKKLDYDPSNLMENIGEAYIYIEEYDKSIHYLKESVRLCEKEIDLQFGGLDRMVLCKQEREKVPNAYKDMEIVLIRRLWKLVFCLFKYVELQIINAKQLDQQNLTEAEKTAKKQRLQKETLEYISKLKKALFPDFKSYAESCMLLNFEIKFMMSIKNFQGARDALGRCLKITQAYAKEYDEITKRLKEKGSKNLYFFRKNKLSGHSRASPNIMEAFYNYTKALLLTGDPKSKDYMTAFCLYADALRKNLASHSVNYLLMNEIKKLLGGLKISLDKLQTTQVFRQSMPYKTLHYGPISKEIEPTLYRVARNPAEVECREYVITLDASYYYSSERELTDQLKYLRERSEYLYDKLIKKFDRVSLIQTNSEIGAQTLCNLTLKQFNQKILRKSLLDMTNYQFFSGRNELLPTLEKVIFRIRNLQCEKVIVFYLKYIDSYLDERAYKGKTKHRGRSKRKMTESGQRVEDVQRGNFIEEIGEQIEQLMATEGLRNCKLILICAAGDECDRLINVFGLRDINKRVWSRSEGLNKDNNVVYIVDEKHKTDLDRILMSKLSNVSDNHVFAL